MLKTLLIKINQRTNMEIYNIQHYKKNNLTIDLEVRQDDNSFWDISDYLIEATFRASDKESSELIHNATEANGWIMNVTKSTGKFQVVVPADVLVGKDYMFYDVVIARSNDPTQYRTTLLSGKVQLTNNQTE
jgi:hypothetical protein